MRAPVVMRGYRNQPEKTAEALDPEGWLHTGDIGEFDDHGYLRIVDRKKELIINAAGKNMSPANIEATMKGASPLIGQVAAIGDGRPYNTALIVLDADFAPAWAAKNGLEGASIEDLAADERMRAAIQAGVDAGNARLARVEQVKKFTIIPGDWAPGGEELTPTMKLKRRPDRREVRGRDRGDVRRQVRRLAGLLTALAALAASAAPAARAARRARSRHPPPRGPDRRPGGARLRRRVRGARAPAVPLRRRDRQPGRDARPVPRPRLRRRAPGGVARAASRRPRRSRTSCPTGATVADRSGSGASFVYAYEKTHQHWHFSSAARYELAAGGRRGAGGREGRLLPVRLLRAGALLRLRRAQGPAGETWCGFNAPSQPSVRMGLSPGGADIYSAQRERQWVDITGLEPGPAVMRAQANPLHCILESDEANNSTSDARQIPGVRVAGAAGSTAAGSAADGRARGHAWSRRTSPRAAAAAARPARAAPATSGPSADGPLSFRVVGEPAHGTVALAPGGGPAGGGDLHAGGRLRGRGRLHLRGDRRARADLEPGHRAGERGGGRRRRARAAPGDRAAGAADRHPRRQAPRALARGPALERAGAALGPARAPRARPPHHLSPALPPRRRRARRGWRSAGWRPRATGCASTSTASGRPRPGFRVIRPRRF